MKPNNHFIDYDKGLFEARLTQPNIFGVNHSYYAYFFEKYTLINEVNIFPNS